MRIEHAQHGLGDFGKIVVEFVARAGVEVGERLDEPLDVRIAGRIGTQTQPAGDFRMRLGEFRAQPADEGQFAVVIGEQFVAHRPLPFTSTLPGGRLERRVERDRFRRRFGMQQSLDAEPQGALRGIGIVEHFHMHALESRLEIAEDLLDHAGEIRTVCGRAEVRSRDVRNPVIHQRN